MLTGKEEIKDLNNNDILNWLGNSLASEFIKKAYFENVSNELGNYRVLYVEFTKPYTIHRISFNNEFTNERTLEEILKAVRCSRQIEMSRFKKC